LPTSASPHEVPDPHAVDPSGADGDDRTDDAPSPRWGFAITVLCDIVLPVALYYLLRGAGFGELAALLISGSAPAAHTLYSAVRHRRLDAIGVFTLAVLAAGALGSLLSGSPRLALARNGVFTGLAGVWLLVTLVTSRPFTYQALVSLMPGRAARLERVWQSDAGFRRVWRALTVLWGAGLLVDAVLRVVMAYTLPVDSVPAVDGVLYAVTWVALQIVTQVTLYRTGTMAKILGPRSGRKGRKERKERGSGRTTTAEPGTGG
jgi:hypothetical protein